MKNKTLISHSEIPAPDHTAEGNGSNGQSKIKRFWNENKIEIFVAVLLGLTAILTAWATWIGSLHSGIQSINFTKSNNLSSEGNADFNAGIQLYMSDSVTWNTIKSYYYDLSIAKIDGNEKKIELIEEKLESYAKQNASDILKEGIKWMDESGKDDPFEMPGITEKYFAAAKVKLEKARELLEEGQKDNAKGDAYNLVTVVYSLVMFLLGIIGIFKKLPNRVAVLMIAVVGLVLATIYMFTIPLPTGFNPFNYFGIK